jgi:hypothetical protein
MSWQLGDDGFGVGVVARVPIPIGGLVLCIDELIRRAMVQSIDIPALAG